MLPRFGPAEAPLDPLRGKVVGIFGYGNQGRAHALNLRDAGLDVQVAARPGGRGEAAARADGWAPVGLEQGARAADVAALLVPDEAAPELVAGLQGEFRPGAIFVLAHGYNAHYGRLGLPVGARMACVAPAGPGVQVRASFLAGGGVTAFLSLSDPRDPELRAQALAYAAALGCARAGIYECSFAQETEVDLFGEQAVLCGGLSALLSAAFDALVGAGYPAEMAYLECVHQAQLTAELVRRFGVEGMRDRISPTALFGDLSRGPRIRAALDAPLRAILEDIRSGRFAAEWQAQAARGPEALRELRATGRHAGLEAARRELGLEPPRP